MELSRSQSLPATEAERLYLDGPKIMPQSIRTEGLGIDEPFRDVSQSYRWATSL